jgi:hypothetical protein
MNRLLAWLLGLMVLFLVQNNEPLRAQTYDITAEVTVDNNYSFGWGDVNGMNPANFFGPFLSTSAGDIYNCHGPNPPPNTAVTGPEFFPNLHPTITDYLYIVAWSDDTDYQGLIGKFTDNNTGTVLYTGDPGWQVFATGIDFDCGFAGCVPNTSIPLSPSTPPRTLVNQQIVLANSNTGPQTSSKGWRSPVSSGPNGFLAVGNFNGGPSNSPPYSPPLAACSAQFPLGSGARWMWYSDATPNVFQVQPTVNNGPGNTMGRGGWREFLIFRMPVKQFPQGGFLKVCKVAGPGVAVGTSFGFTASAGSTNIPFTVSAGPPAPGWPPPPKNGECVVVSPTFPVGSTVTVTETIPAGYTLSSITVAPPSQLAGVPNLAGGSVNVTIGSGVTEVTFTDYRPMPRLRK